VNTSEARGSSAASRFFFPNRLESRIFILIWIQVILNQQKSTLTNEKNQPSPTNQPTKKINRPTKPNKTNLFNQPNLQVFRW